MLDDCETLTLGTDRYEWATSNGVQLIDEYDSISSQILPLHSLSPADLRRRIRLLEDTNKDGRDHCILTIAGGKRTYGGAKWRDPVGESFEGLIEGIAHLLPDMKLPIYLHDASYLQMDWEWMKAYIEAAEAGRCEFGVSSRLRERDLTFLLDLQWLTRVSSRRWPASLSLRGSFPSSPSSNSRLPPTERQVEQPSAHLRSRFTLPTRSSRTGESCPTSGAFLRPRSQEQHGVLRKPIYR